MQLLRRDEGKAFRQVKPHLVTKHAQRAGSRPVHLFDTLVENALHEVVIGAHRVTLMARLWLGAIENRVRGPFSRELSRKWRELYWQALWLYGSQRQ